MTSRGRVLVTNRIKNSGGGEKWEEIAERKEKTVRWCMAKRINKRKKITANVESNQVCKVQKNEKENKEEEEE